MLRMHHLRAAFIVFIAGPLAGCHASYPFQPSAPTPVAFQVFYRNALAPQLVGASFGFRAYVFNSDGVWEDVTSAAAWTSSNSVVVAGTQPSSFTAIAPGVADVTATYQGLVSSVPLTVYETDRRPFPFLAITTGDPHVVGQAAFASVSLRAAPGQTQSPLAAAVWTSSDDRVVTVAAINPNSAQVRAVGAGTARITVSLNGVTDSYGLSVQP